MFVETLKDDDDNNNNNNIALINKVVNLEHESINRHSYSHISLQIIISLKSD